VRIFFTQSSDGTYSRFFLGAAFLAGALLTLTVGFTAGPKGGDALVFATFVGGAKDGDVLEAVDATVPIGSLEVTEGAFDGAAVRGGSTVSGAAAETWGTVCDRVATGAVGLFETLRMTRTVANTASATAPPTTPIRIGKLSSSTRFFSVFAGASEAYGGAMRDSNDGASADAIEGPG
jgi:hypothetical protein